MSDPENNWPAPPGDNAPGADAAAPLVPQDAALAAPVAAEAAVPEDLRAPWSWLELLLFLVYAFAASLAVSLVVALGAFFAFGISPWQLDKIPNGKATLLVLGQALWSGAAMLYFFGVARLRKGGPFWRALGWRELRLGRISGSRAVVLCLSGGVTLAMVVQVASAGMGKKGTLPIEEMFRSRGTVLMLMALGLLVAPLVEETMFRGFLYPVFARQFGVPAGIVITGVLFGLLHAAQLWGGWGQIALLMIVGIVFTYVRARTGTVWASYLFHLGYNGILFLGFFIYTGGLRHMPTS